MKCNFLVALLLISSASLSSCLHKKPEFVKTEGMVWNTIYHITYKGPESLKDSILSVFDEVSKSLSVFEKNSLVSNLNMSDSIRADSHLSEVYEASRLINKMSHGNFDPTVSPLVDAWGFGLNHTPNADTIPVAIDSILSFIGIEKTGIKNNVIYKTDPRIRFNFSAIAKGYGCDAVGKMFQRNGVENFMIEIGGELTLRGESPSEKKWNIAVDAPVENSLPGEQTAYILRLTDVGIATSGNYRNFRQQDSKITAHTISPVTGRPIVSEILSATIIAPNCMLADGIATACMASNTEEAKKLIKALDVEGLLIFNDSVWMSSGFKNYIFEPSSQ